MKLLPTPSAGQHNYDEDAEPWEERRQRLLAKGINGNGAGTPLPVAVKLLPTPTVGDAASARNATATRHRIPPAGIHAGETLTDALVPSTSSPRAIPASPSPTPADEGESRTPAICGLLSSQPFAFFDPATSSWRTSQATLASGSDEFSATWPKAGTTRDGYAYELRMSERRTAGSGSSSLLLTPTVSDAKPPGPAELAEWRAAEIEGRTVAETYQRLRNQVPSLLPTPQAADSERASKTMMRGNPTLLGALTPPPSDDGSES